MVQLDHLTDIWTTLFFGTGVIWTAIGMRSALIFALGWRVPFVVNFGSVTVGDVARLSIPIPFSRRRFWLREAFPASRRGEFQISVTFAGESAGWINRNFTIEVVELLDAQPMRFLKYVEQSRALNAEDPDFKRRVKADIK